MQHYHYSRLDLIPIPDPPPPVIFLDAVGTLFGVRDSVGTVYGYLADRFGVTVSAEILDRAFYESFKASAPCAFPGTAPAEIPRQEYLWWQAVAAKTFEKAEVLEQFSDFAAFFADAYTHFSTIEPWQLYPDVHPTLQRWHQHGIQLGVISNFDTRLYTVLEALQLQPFFTSITISTEVGAAKPDPAIFIAALQKHAVDAPAVWHIGDSEHEDYVAAQQAGLQGIWLQRSTY
jgi:putative hydrolase of the HAD superfamily